MTRSKIAGLLLLAAFFFGASQARAAQYYGFVCSVSYSTDVQYGQYGAITVYLTSAANCGGSSVTNDWICSTGYTNSACGTAPVVLPRSDAQMVALFTAFSNAANNAAYSAGISYSIPEGVAGVSIRPY